MAPEARILALDCGSTFLKAALFDAGLTRLAEAHVHVPYAHRDGTRVELDGDALMAAFRDLLADIRRQDAAGAGQIRTAAITSQAQTFALTDPTGQPLTPFLSWLDRRAEDECRSITDSLSDAFHAHCSLAPPVPQLQICKVLWLRRRCPDLWRRGCHLVTLPGFLSGWLGAPNVTDRNLAAMGGLYSLRLGDWWPQALDLCGLVPSRLPGLVDVGEGVPCRRTHLPPALAPGLRVVCAGNDQTACAYANGCNAGHILVTLGTALVVYYRRRPEDGPPAAGTFWGPYPGGGGYGLATRDEGCLALDWARENHFGGIPAEAMDRMAAEVIARGLQPRAPLFHPSRIGTEAAWSAEADPQGMAYAVLEGICFSVRELLSRTGTALGAPTMVHVAGGGSRSRLWLQLLADTLALPTRRAGGDALLGAAAMAAPEAGAGSDGAAMPCEPDGRRVAVLETRYRTWRKRP
ncbi:MAG: hypothetical protein JXR77_13725 [Lentisphaeria bacterium]|nr:hypothetical protein [Lentisphaeria bacterium]